MKRIFNLLSSFGFACIILLLLFVLTFFGTLEQVDHGIYEVQQKYFNSPFLVHKISNVPIPMPGGAILLPLLFLNLICGGFIRIKKNRSKSGILIVHTGIALLLISGFITYAFSFDGHLTLYENERSDAFQSYYEWEITITEPLSNGKYKNRVIPGEQFVDIAENEIVKVHGEGLPFTLELSQFIKNSQPTPKGPMFDVDVPVIDGYFLKELPLEKEAERNVSGLYIKLLESKSGKQHEGILWGFQRHPLTITVDGTQWSINLHPKRWKLPFTVVLDKFTRELHPRTGIAKVFMSDITKIENGVSQPIKISMNEPLRHRGYTLFQSSWGPANAKPGEPLFSTFAVVKNPADKLPEYSCILIAIGLVIHFSQRLLRYIKSQRLRTGNFPQRE